nr:hypothetical protein [Tanacetum cinerariifolium]GEX20773.1 hypothetical protein [Tanacetum cinerariifolium]
MRSHLITPTTSRKPNLVVSNPFDVLTSVENDVELGANGGPLNLASQATNSSGSSFLNVDASSPSTTPVIKKFDKIEKLIIEEKVTLVDDEGKPLEMDGYGTQSLLEQWMESYENGDYKYDPYDDDMYEETTREDSPVEVVAPSPKSKSKLARGHQKRTVQNEDAPRQTAWTNKK